MSSARLKAWWPTEWMLVGQLKVTYIPKSTNSSSESEGIVECSHYRCLQKSVIVNRCEMPDGCHCALLGQQVLFFFMTPHLMTSFCENQGCCCGLPGLCHYPNEAATLSHSIPPKVTGHGLIWTLTCTLFLVLAKEVWKNLPRFGHFHVLGVSKEVWKNLPRFSHSYSDSLQMRMFACCKLAAKFVLFNRYGHHNFQRSHQEVLQALQYATRGKTGQLWVWKPCLDKEFTELLRCRLVIL